MIHVPSASADPPPVSPQASAAGLVDVRTVVPDAVIDLRYATTNNFTGEQLYPAGARCLIHESMAPGLAVAANQLRAQGNTLVFWDCYRPHDVQVRMFQEVPNPNWVARPTDYARSHEAGRSVDVTIVGLDMGTDFDDFTPRSLAYADRRRYGRTTGQSRAAPLGHAGRRVDRVRGGVVALRRARCQGSETDLGRAGHLI